MNNEEIKVLDLFSGIGGFSYSAHLANRGATGSVFRTSAFVERDQFCQRVLRKHWPDVPIFDDVRTIPTDGLGRIDLICGGFPCQPWSVAGQQRGAEDDRDLWPAMVALVEKLRPRFVLGENVRGFVNEPLGLQRSLSDLESIGYQAVPFIIPACSKFAPHRRDRVWIVAHCNGEGPRNKPKAVARTDKQISERRKQLQSRHSTRDGGKVVAHTQRQRFKHGQHERRSRCKARVSKRRGKNVANTSNWRGEQTEWQGREGVAGGSSNIGRFKTKGQKDKQNVADTSDTRLQGCEQRQAYGEGAWASRSVTKCGEDGWRENGRKPRSEFRRMANGVSRRLDEAGQHPGWENGEPEGMERVSVGVKDRAARLKALGNSILPQVAEQIFRAILEGWDQ